jgi:2,4-dienoyl-CoA reductase-like NADH-dependent reductase (Old Yellow Enzyme family)
MNLDLTALLRPFPFGAKTLRNRVVMAPMTRNRSPNGVPTGEVAAYYRRRAEGGVGLIITEGATVEHLASNGYPGVPRFYGEDALDGWRRVVREVHDAGGAIIPQLWHVGSVRLRGIEPDPGVPGCGPSAVVHPFYEGQGEPPAALGRRDIEDIVAAFGRAAGAARDAGFDGVEIHGAHGYLIDQFLWPETNRREDEYGGSLENRARLAREVVAAVRGAAGPRFPVVFRFSQWKQGGYTSRIVETPAELERLTLPLSAAGVDVFHASTRRFWIPEFEGSDLNLAGWTKKITGKPAITVGSVGLDSDFLGAWLGHSAKPTGIDSLVERLARDEFDLVAVGRALLVDPLWFKKIVEGRYGEILPFTPEALGTLS